MYFILQLLSLKKFIFRIVDYLYNLNMLKFFLCLGLSLVWAQQPILQPQEQMLPSENMQQTSEIPNQNPQQIPSSLSEPLNTQQRIPNEQQHIHNQQIQSQKITSDEGQKNPSKPNIENWEQVDLQKTNEFQEQYQIPQWILEEERLNKQSDQEQIEVEETFSFILASKQETIFKWNPQRKAPITLALEINVNFLTEVGQLAIPQYDQKLQYVEIFTKKSEKSQYYHIDNIYVRKRIKINFETDYCILRIINEYRETVLVTAIVEFGGRVLEKGIHDGSLTLMKEKMINLQNLMKKTDIDREHGRKQEVGFLEHVYGHQSAMLVLTGIQLITILGSAFIQLIMIKSLVENRQIV